MEAKYKILSSTFKISDVTVSARLLQKLQFVYLSVFHI